MDPGGEAPQTPSPQDGSRAKEALNRQKEEQKKLLESLLSTFHHFFGDIKALFQGIADPRNPKKITYPHSSLLFAGILLFLFRLGSRRQVGSLLRNDPSILNFQTLFGIEAFPHGDTLEALYERLDSDEVQGALTAMTEALIRSKVLYPWRLFDKYFVVGIDGTGTLTFHDRHCPHCLTRTDHGKTLYYHNVLEAKILTPNGFVFSLMSEFIENPGEKPTKQDCELKAFYRLAKRIKKRFPRLPLLLSMDGLFAGGPTFALCRKYGWHFMIVLKDGDLPYVNGEFESLAPEEPENRRTVHTGKRGEVLQEYRWVNNIQYRDTARKEHILSVLECRETKPEGEGVRKTTKFKWVTDIEVAATNVVALSNDAGRIRWKIENEGFNVQKNGGYELEHGYSNHWGSGKVFYLLLQMAHMVSQLLEKGSLLKKAFPKGFGSLKNLAFRLFEAWRNMFLPLEIWEAIRQARIQIRFDSS